jgi:integrase
MEQSRWGMIEFDGTNLAERYRVTILLALKCGRHQELMHLGFSDINFTEKTLRVQGKPRWNFRVKTDELRLVRIPDDVLCELKAWKEQQDGKSLILGTKNGNPTRSCDANAKRSRCINSSGPTSLSALQRN